MQKNTKFRVLFSLFSASIAFVCQISAGAQQTPSKVLAEKDLAIAFPLESPDLISVLDSVSAQSTLFPAAWYSKILEGFRPSPVGDALTIENTFADWKLVSARLVPCSPLGVTTTQQNDLWCWPEVRLVWQPVLRNFVQMGRTLKSYADDRAVHALYDVAPETGGLSAAEAQSAGNLIVKIRQALNRGASQNAVLTPQELQEFTTLRKRVVQSFLANVLALRSGAFAAPEFGDLGLRPETSEKEESKAFKKRFFAFLSAYTAPSKIRALTAFSLPEGRQAPLLDEWIFLSFQATNGILVPEDILLRSNVDGRTLFNFGKTPRASQQRDDDKIYDFLQDNTDDKLKTEINNSVLLLTKDKKRLGPNIANGRVLLVPNTSCGSCHKLNHDAFDFHNLSYLESRSMTPSPRVKLDVEIDLQWLAKF